MILIGPVLTPTLGAGFLGDDISRPLGGLGPLVLTSRSTDLGILVLIR